MDLKASFCIKCSSLRHNLPNYCYLNSSLDLELEIFWCPDVWTEVEPTYIFPFIKLRVSSSVVILKNKNMKEDSFLLCFRF